MNMIEGKNLPLPSCASPSYLAAAYGGATGVFGLDGLISRFPPVVHHALAGALADYQCRGGVNVDTQMAMAMASGFFGGVAGRFVRGYFLNMPMGIPM